VQKAILGGVKQLLTSEKKNFKMDEMVKMQMNETSELFIEKKSTIVFTLYIRLSPILDHLSNYDYLQKGKIMEKKSRLQKYK